MTEAQQGLLQRGVEGFVIGWFAPKWVLTVFWVVLFNTVFRWAWERAGEEP